MNFVRMGPSASLTSDASHTLPMLLTLAAVASSLTYSLGHVSGGHLNPAVTFAVFLRRHLTFIQLVLYTMSHFLGFLLSGVTCIEILGSVQSPADLKVSTSDGGLNSSKCFAIVSIFSFCLCYAVLCTSTSAAQSGNSHFGIAAGFSAAVGMVICAIKGTGSSLNYAFDLSLICSKWFYDTEFPKRFTDYANFSNFNEGLWFLVAAPIAGSIVSALFYRYVKVTAFTKRSHGLFNRIIKRVAPFLVECIGTFLISFVWMAAYPSSEEATDSAWSSLACCYMAISFAMVYSGGFISGGHFNPAVSFAVFLQGSFGAFDFIMYTFVQAVGAFGAGSLAWELFAKSPVPEIGSGVSKENAFIMEGIFASMLVFAYLNSACSKSKENQGNSFYGIAISAVLFSASMLIGKMSGGLVNPAIAVASFASRNVWQSKSWNSNLMQDSWVMIASPLAAALVCGLVYRACLIGIDIKCCNRASSDNSLSSTVPDEEDENDDDGMADEEKAGVAI